MSKIIQNMVLLRASSDMENVWLLFEKIDSEKRIEPPRKLSQFDKNMLKALMFNPKKGNK